MSFAKIPRVFLTLRCNYKCSFCPYIKEQRNELSGDEWIELLRGYDSKEIVLTGGEPHLHKDFLQIVNELGKDHVMRLYSNGSFPIQLLDRLEVKTKWYISYHSGQLNSATDVARKCRALLEKGHQLINVHTNEASHTPNADFKIFNDFGLTLIEEKDMFTSGDWQMHKLLTPPTKGTCTYPRIYIDPTGTRYHCVDALESEDSERIVPHYKFPSKVECSNMARCNACDICTVEGVERV